MWLVFKIPKCSHKTLWLVFKIQRSDWFLKFPNIVIKRCDWSYLYGDEDSLYAISKPVSAMKLTSSQTVYV